ncbi:hypothetical protein ACNOYE_03125 [Nannocystaceae bacterium ST9]
MDFADVTSETIERAGLDDKRFEHFVRELLVAERNLRHREDAEIKGPVSKYRGDSKRDLVFVVHGPPKLSREHFSAALTRDDVGVIWYSCKGGSNWSESFLEELGRAAAKPGGAPGPTVKNRPPAPLLDHLAAGRRFVFVVTAALIDDDGFLDKIAEVLGFWLDHERGGRPPTLRSQLEFIEANRLADFISTHRPANLGEEFRRALGLVEPTGLRLWAQWTNEIGRGRELPDFESDPERDEILAAIADPTNRIVRVFGAPGVGKTRLIHEGISRIGEEARVRYCNDLDVNLRIVQDPWLREEAGAVWLVMDEVRTIDVDRVEPLFDANAPNGARLIVVGTSDEGTRSEPGRAYALDRLGDDATRRLIAHEFSGFDAPPPGPDELAAMLHLSENYPWYAVLLARAFAKEPRAIERGDDEAARWSAGARRVLAGTSREYSDDSAWDREAVLRAKCLLVAMMTRDLELEWDDLCERYGEQLARAIDEVADWEKIVKREKICRDRQILRQSGLQARRRYVSPNNLARIILNRFFTDPDLGPKLRRHAPEFRATLLTIAKSVGATRVAENLARGEWEELIRRANEGIHSVEIYLGDGSASELASHDHAEMATRAICVTLRSFDEARIVEAKHTVAILRNLLARLSERAISEAAFLMIEETLLWLARSEHQAWTGNATGIWQSLFHPGNQLPHQRWQVRLRRLDTRLSDPDESRRRLAIEALDHGLLLRKHEPRGVDLAARTSHLWDRLVAACDDGTESIAHQARVGVIRHFVGGLAWGLAPEQLDRLSLSLPAWTAQERQALAGTIENAALHDWGEPLRTTLASIGHSLVPTNLQERLIAKIEHWRPRLIGEDERDDSASSLALAAELLTRDDLLTWALDWLDSPRAVGGQRFFRALGRVDASRKLLDTMAARVEAGAPSASLANYLMGWAEQSSTGEAEAWLADRTRSDSLADAEIQFLTAQPASTHRWARIQRLVVSHRVQPSTLGPLFRHPWMRPDDFGHSVELLALLGDRVDQVDQVDQVDMAPLLVHASSELIGFEVDLRLREWLSATMHRALIACLERRVPIRFQPRFIDALLGLALNDRISAVVDILVRSWTPANNVAPNSGLGSQALSQLLQSGLGDRLWPHFSERLLARSSAALTSVLADNGLTRHVDSTMLLTWAGDDPRRAAILAELTGPHDVRLDDVARRLLIRFGGHGDIASALARRARTPPTLAQSGFERRQREHARVWMRDPEPAVREWASQLEAELTRTIDEDEARASYRRMYG